MEQPVSALIKEQELIKQFLDKVDRRKRYVRYDFQELGLMLASKLGEWSRRSFYIKLAKEEDKKLLMQAYMYAADASESKRAALFLWRLGQLKAKTTYRAFTAIYFNPSLNPIINEVYERLNKLIKKKRLKRTRVTPPEHWHITLYFWGELKGRHYPYIVRMVRKLREKYGETVTVQFNTLEQFKDRYLWLTDTDQLPYRVYHSQFKLISSNVANEVFPQKGRFKPHLTLARLKGERFHLDDRDMLKFPVELKGEIVFVISRLTPDGPKYRIHEWY